MADRSGLENRRPERVRGFESLPLRLYCFDVGNLFDVFISDYAERVLTRLSKTFGSAVAPDSPAEPSLLR